MTINIGNLHIVHIYIAYIAQHHKLYIVIYVYVFHKLIVIGFVRLNNNK